MARAARQTLIDPTQIQIVHVWRERSRGQAVGKSTNSVHLGTLRNQGDKD
jgi:hypothetical protein